MNKTTAHVDANGVCAIYRNGKLQENVGIMPDGMFSLAFALLVSDLQSRDGISNMRRQEIERLAARMVSGWAMSRD